MFHQILLTFDEKLIKKLYYFLLNLKMEDIIESILYALLLGF